MTAAAEPAQGYMGGINASRQRSGITATPSGRGMNSIAPVAPINQRSNPAHDTHAHQNHLYVHHHATPSGNPYQGDPYFSAGSSHLQAGGPPPRMQDPYYPSAQGGISYAARTAPPRRQTDGGDSDWGGSDAEAYVDFQRVAKTFRTWRSNAYVAKESR